MFSYGALALVATLLVVGAARSDRRRRRFVVVCSGYAVLLFSIHLFGLGSAGMRPGYDAATWHLAGARYTLAPILFLMTALLVVVDGQRERSGSRALVPAVVAAVACLVAANFALTSERSLGPTWSSELKTARARCLTADGSRGVDVPVAPKPFGFVVSASCDRIR